MTILARLSDAELRRALERADQRQPTVHLDEIGDGFVRAAVECLGTCPIHDYLDGWHDCFITWQGIGTCDDGSTRGLCVHLAALLVSMGGQLPEPPPCGLERGCGAPITYGLGGNGHACDLRDDPAVPVFVRPKPSGAYECQVDGCGLLYLSEREATIHARMVHAAVGDFQRIPAVPSTPAIEDLAYVPTPAAEAAPASDRGDGGRAVKGVERPTPLKGWRSKAAAAADIELEHAARRAALGIEE